MKFRNELEKAAYLEAKRQIELENDRVLKSKNDTDKGKGIPDKPDALQNERYIKKQAEIEFDLNESDILKQQIKKEQQVTDKGGKTFKLSSDELNEIKQFQGGYKSGIVKEFEPRSRSTPPGIPNLRRSSYKSSRDVFDMRFYPKEAREPEIKIKDPFDIFSDNENKIPDIKPKKSTAPSTSDFLNSIFTDESESNPGKKKSGTANMDKAEVKKDSSKKEVLQTSLKVVPLKEKTPKKDFKGKNESVFNNKDKKPGKTINDKKPASKRSKTKIDYDIISPGGWV